MQECSFADMAEKKLHLRARHLGLNLSQGSISAEAAASGSPSPIHTPAPTSGASTPAKQAPFMHNTPTTHNASPKGSIKKGKKK